jgi:hypothetical protein
MNEMEKALTPRGVRGVGCSYILCFAPRGISAFCWQAALSD